jgi:hypothetical protein
MSNGHDGCNAIFDLISISLSAILDKLLVRTILLLTVRLHRINVSTCIALPISSFQNPVQNIEVKKIIWETKKM